ncbi:MAG: hypothetical protein HS116_02265 [Planctomycetes bacterium]|nr:hypothetical protein [Planctomycetota bacterium]
MDLRELALKVKECRDLQKRYFRAPKGQPFNEVTALLRESKRAERELDSMVERILSPQQNLFGAEP